MEGQLQKEALSSAKRTPRLLCSACNSDHTCDLVGRAALAGIDHDQELHDGVVNLGTARLHDKDILFTDARENSNTCLALTERLASPHELSGRQKQARGAHI